MLGFKTLVVNSLPTDNISDQYKLNALADIKINVCPWARHFIAQPSTGETQDRHR